MRVLLASVLAAISFTVPASAGTLSDSKITESSWLALDVANHGIAYTGNDENGPLFSVNSTTGKKLAETKLAGTTLLDPESADTNYNGALWVADIGANTSARKTLALYVVGAPGAVSRTVTPERYRFTYNDGKSHNAETFMFNPVTRNRYIVTKEANGLLFRNDAGSLSQATVGQFRMVGSRLPAYITECKFTPHARFVLCRQKDKTTTITVLNGDSFVTLGTFTVTKVTQPESLATDGVSVWFGSEGKNSPLLRATIPAKWQDAA